MKKDGSPRKIVYPLAMDNWDEREREAINGVVDSNRFTMGEQVKLFESEVATKFGSKFAVMVNWIIRQLPHASGRQNLIAG